MQTVKVYIKYRRAFVDDFISSAGLFLERNVSKWCVFLFVSLVYNHKNNSPPLFFQSEAQLFAFE